jgi:hypothetical protein
MRALLSLVACLFLLACGNDDPPGGAARTDGGELAQNNRADGSAGASNDAAAGNDASAQPKADGGTNAPQTDGGSVTPQVDAGPATAPSAARYFPAGAFMYQRVDGAPLDPDSDTITAWLQNNGGWGTGTMKIDLSIEVLAATASTPRRAFVKTGDFYDPDCDFLPFPVPTGGALEGESGYACESDGDCHLIVVDRAANRLYEMWRANIVGSTFNGGCATVWDMTRVYGDGNRGEQCTSADAAGFPIAPLLFSADEVAAGSVDHAIRFILPNARMRAKTYQHPGSHAGGPSGPASAPIYGSRWRLKSSFDLSKLPSAGARVVARALQQYGMALADGGNIALTGQSDRFTTKKWSGLLTASDLTLLKPTDFEVVQTGEPIPLTFDCTRTPITQ